MDIPTRPGDLLAQPTRADLFSMLADLRRPASTDELAERLSLHPNGVRAHLERLHEAGLVERELERQSRGRPRDVWSISRDAQPGGDPPTAYATLGRWLVRAMAASRVRVRDVEAMGRAIGRELAAADDRGPADERFQRLLTAMGFQPQAAHTPEGTLTYCLANCPYRQVVRERQALVCGLHRGVTRGMLDEIDPRTKLVAFVPKDPDPAGCVIELRGPLARDAAGFEESAVERGPGQGSRPRARPR
jgi:predicted ArsR family transcriptional regulator